MEKVLSQEQVNKALARKRTNARILKVMAIAFIYLVLILMYLPLIYITVFSFSTNTTPGKWGSDGFSFANYTSLFNLSGNVISQKIWSAVGNTVAVALVAALVATILGTLGAIGIFYLRKKWMQSTLDFVTQIPMANAEIVTAVSLCILFVLTSTLFGLERSFFTLVIGHVVLAIPYVVISVKPKLEQMDPSLYEAAMDLGATQTQALFKVIIPDILPAILTGFLLSITLSLDDYVITAFTKPTSGGFETISTYVDAATVKRGLPTQFRAFTALLFAAILFVMIFMNIKGNRDAKKRHEERN